jgi:hypothetical protein
MVIELLSLFTYHVIYLNGTEKSFDSFDLLALQGMQMYSKLLECINVHSNFFWSERTCTPHIKFGVHQK